MRVCPCGVCVLQQEVEGMVHTAWGMGRVDMCHVESTSGRGRNSHAAAADWACETEGCIPGLHPTPGIVVVAWGSATRLVHAACACDMRIAARRAVRLAYLLGVGAVSDQWPTWHRDGPLGKGMKDHRKWKCFRHPTCHVTYATCTQPG
jgi:hypothetical protein